MQNLINTNVGQYKLVEVIGRGRTSTVYKAYQPSLRRFVAIKVLHHLDQLGATRFEREAQMIAQLHHPNILPIFDYGQQDDLRYFVTQYIEQSMTLSDMLAQQPMDHIAALHMITHLLAGLAYAHSHGIIHRDIKPSNILLPSPTWPLLADFGIARLIDDLRHLTPPGQTVGTAAYMAPELARGLPADARSDLYSVGIVLYEILTGQVPFDAVTPSAVLNMHIHTEPPNPRSLNQELPVEIETLLLRALAKDQAARYQSAEDMAADLERIVSRLERERALAELLSPPTLASVATIYTTRKLASDSAGAKAPTQHTGNGSPAGRHPTTNTPNSGPLAATTVGSESIFRSSWWFSPPFFLAIVVGLISGMLVAYLVRSHFAEAGPIPEPAATQATQTSTPGATRKQIIIDLPTAFPAGLPGITGEQVPPSPTIPTMFAVPPQDLPSPALPPLIATDTPMPLHPSVPTRQPSLNPTEAQIPEPSAGVSATPAQLPTEAMGPSSAPELATSTALIPTASQENSTTR